MARMYRHYQKRQRDDKPRINLNPEVSQGLLAILLFVVAGLSILSFFNMAGVAGIFIDSTLALIFGSVRYVFPLMLITIAVLLIKDLEYNYRHTHTIDAVLFFLSFNGLIHIQKPIDELFSLATQGYAGGFFGLALSWPLLKYVGYWGGLMILIGLLLVSIIFLFNTTLAQIVEINKRFFMMLGWGGQKIVDFFAGFKKNKSEEAVKFSIKGEHTGETDEDEEEMVDEEDERIFSKKVIDDTDNEETENEGEEEAEEEVVFAQKEEIIVEKPDYSNFKLPAVDLLFTSKSKPTSGDIKGNAETIKDTFQNFGIEVDMGEVRVGPTVTQYSMKPAKGVKLTRITTLSNDLALALAAHPIRIEAPIPGQSLVGIEVPNEKVAMVTLKELLESPEFKDRGHNLMIALGKDVAGKVWFADLPKMPHLLVAGSTGSGKTVCINTIILSLLYQNTPETLRFIMVDPKRVELTLYNGIPHLLTPVITDPAKTVNALKWTIGEMERRFDTLAKAGCRDILSYNKISDEKLPYIVFIIDELADLMATAASEVEAGIIRVAQMARAVGIHLIVATQRPSVEVITGLMKANIPARIAFSVASLIDSRTILDCSGAEKLLGRGDMLYLTADLSKPKRVQGAFVSEEEMKRVVRSIKGDTLPTYDESIVSKNSASGSGTVNLFGGASDDQDSLFDEAKRTVIESGKASASLLQRRLKVGYARAARLLDELEE
ncbi:MAG: DNA translocase FtsK 4TM domain-containing protein, partial [Candidatus Magasanikbacteria bacterium]|nr:DNA translocase FtsK 4TM domain-containing protein [Candidatus Magasanikbacteria bacterium]